MNKKTLNEEMDEPTNLRNCVFTVPPTMAASLQGRLHVPFPSWTATFWETQRCCHGRTWVDSNDPTFM